ncbi:MAG TPA: NPCBM/NEW2 domain-containing protein [Rariglobus sp.]|jgi:alpha-galactosidase|nr:NPCBM/NEW2 domain-containing protein [Rariglobus sp.]
MKLPLVRRFGLMRRFVCVAAILGMGPFAFAENIPLSSLDLKSVEQEWGRAQQDKAVTGGPLIIAGQTFKNGLGTHANGRFVIDLGGGSDRFTAMVGVNDDTKAGSVEFVIRGDDYELWRSGIMRIGDAAKKADVSLKGIRVLSLEVTDAGDGIAYDHADWADANFEVSGTKPKPYEVPRGEAVILTPKSGPEPRVNGPAVFGVRPGSPFLYSIPVTGERPMVYAVEGLPNGLALDAATGRITGTLDRAGEYPVTLKATNKLGSAEKHFRIVVGDEIALTPPMGWNSWNCWGAQVDQEKVLSSARALVKAGLDQHGWTYINIDDAWQGKRGGPYNAIQPDEKRFPDIKAFCDEVHALGLKTGIYSTPWTISYAGRIGSTSENPDGTKPIIPHEWKRNNTLPWAIGRYSFAASDAKQWAEWGIDYLKYDWNPNQLPETQEMYDALRKSGRDIAFSLSNSMPFSNISDLSKVSSCWRITGDIVDTWGSMSFNGFQQDRWAPFQKPGHYNDPDMLVVGQVGWGKPHPTRLTPDEQYTHISLWSLLSAPLLLGCDLVQLDDFTIGLLTNDEVLAVDQDSLCRQATCVSKDGNTCVYAKKLEDGSWAVGLFNRGLFPKTVTVKLSDLQLSGAQRVRDLWRQKDIGSFEKEFSSPVAPHGVVLIRISPKD